MENGLAENAAHAADQQLSDSAIDTKAQVGDKIVVNQKEEKKEPTVPQRLPEHVFARLNDTTPDDLLVSACESMPVL